MIQRFRNLIRLARVSLTSTDSTNMPTAQIEGLGKTSDNITMVYPYGIFANAPEDTLGLTLQLYGQESSIVMIPFNPLDKNGKSLRFKNLKKGEVVLGNVLTGTMIKLASNGDVEIDGKNNIKLTVKGDLTLNVTGNVNIDAGGNATVNATGDVKVEAGGMAEIVASGSAKLQGTTADIAASTVNVGTGALIPIARLGDTVQIIIPPPSPAAGTYTGTIIATTSVNKST